MKTCTIIILCLIGLNIYFFSFPRDCIASSPFAHLFGYRAVKQTDLRYLTQWTSALKRHAKQDVPNNVCKDGFFKRCQMKRWFKFINSVRHLPRRVQIREVNRYANRNPYVLDIVNYGVEDYWAIVKEFLRNGGDCEDYAITKYFSLEWLGFPMKDIRIVVLQDTNLRTPHAVMAVRMGNDILIMDNQTDDVVSHRKIAHYIPLYSLNKRHWWLHLPPGL